MAFLFLFVTLAAAALQPAKEWRGITPLHSTRADVEWLLGPPSIDRSLTTFYEFEKEEVSFHYADGPCGAASGGWNVPRGTVIGIGVRPRRNSLKLADLRLDEARYKKERDKHVLDIFTYTNEEEGISYQVNTRDGDGVTSVDYFPAAKDGHLRCSATGEGLEETTKVDSYPDLPLESERKRLDVFAERIRQNPSSQAYIIAYAGRRARAGEAEARAKRAKEYLIKVRGVDAKRIVTVDGGHQEEPAVELYLVPPGARPPLVTPTVEPGEVQIIKTRHVRNIRRPLQKWCK